MDVPNVNLSFENSLVHLWEQISRTSFVDVGTFLLLTVHTAFRKELYKLGIDVDKFFHNIHFLF